MTYGDRCKALLLAAAAGLFAGCAGHHAAAGSSPAPSPAVSSGAANTSKVPAANTQAPPVYPGARVDTSQGENGVLAAPTLRMVTRYYKTTDSWDAVSRWYLAHTPGWGSYAKPGGGDLTLGRHGSSPATIMVSGDKTGAEIVVEQFHTKQ